MVTICPLDFQQNMQTVSVNLAHAPYRILVGEGLLARSGELSAEVLRPRRCAVVTDETVRDLHARKVLDSLKNAGWDPVLLAVPAGETSKSLAMAGQLCDRMLEHGLDRHAAVMALGGGVVGDLAGFVAGIFQRGIPFVQLPTTLMAQVDSSVGGKTGVNAAAGKNLIGVFHQPALVVCDVEALRTLPVKVRNEGMAEVIKHACIRDADMLAALEKGGLPDEDMVARNVAIKAHVVEADERETSGERAHLNFGHTIGHAIEHAAGYGNLLHGEAVSLGLVAACWLSCRHATFAAEDAARVENLLKRYELPVRLPEDISDDDIMAALRLDKKFVAGKMRFVLLNKPGEAFITDKVSHEDVVDALSYLRGRA